MLYCICRKPYDQRPMIACDKCDEWYHFDCIKLSSAPKSYICPACKVDTLDEGKCTSSSIEQERQVHSLEPLYKKHAFFERFSRKWFGFSEKRSYSEKGKKVILLLGQS